jgi:large subunit ribosomal protein L25
MSVDFAIDAEPRDDLGRGASRRLRRAGRVPAIIYGGNEKPTSISLDHNKMVHSLENEAFFSHIITVNLAGKQYKTILRDLQRHPAKPVLLHLDFQRITADEELHVHVPLHFIGEDICPGVKLEGGSISHNLIEVEISCLPKDIPEFIEVDVSQLKIGDSVHLTDLVLPTGVTLTALTHGEGHDQQILNVHTTKVAVEEDLDAPVEESGEEDTDADTDS